MVFILKIRVVFMFYDNELRFLQKMLTKCHLQNMTMDPNEPVDERLDKGLRNLFGANGYSETFFDFFPDTRPNTVYRVTDIFLCRYLFFMLPYCEKETVFIIGPYLNEDISRQQILEQGERMGVSPKYYRELEFFYTSLPVIKEEHYIFAMVHTFAEFLWSGADRYESVDINRESSAAFITHHLEPRVPSEGSSLNIQAMESRYDFENQLMMAVSQGNLHKAELMMTHFSTLAFENRTPDPLRNMKNYCIIMNTLLRKAAEQGGVHPVQLDSISSDFARRIEQLRSISTVTGFMREIGAQLFPAGAKGDGEDRQRPDRRFKSKSHGEADQRDSRLFFGSFQKRDRSDSHRLCERQADGLCQAPFEKHQPADPDHCPALRHFGFSLFLQNVQKNRG